MLRGAGHALVLNWRAARGWLQLVVGAQLLAAVLVAASVLSSAQAFADLIAALQDRTSWATAVSGCTGFVAALAGRSLAQQVETLATTRLSEQVRITAQEQVMQAATRARLISFQDAEFFDALQRANAGALQCSTAITQATKTVSTVLSSVAASTAVFLISPFLAFLIPVALAPLAFAEIRNLTDTYSAATALIPKQRDMTYLHQLMLTPGSAREIRAFQSAPWIQERWRRIATVVADTTCRTAIRCQARTAVARLTSSVLFVATAGLTLAHTDLPAGAAMASAYALLNLRTQTATLITMSTGVQANAMFLADLARISQTDAERDEAATGSRAVPNSPHIQLKSVSFRYPGSPHDTLRSITLDISPGTTIALLGPNGSGKTTLAMLLASLYEPTGGSITWNGTDTRDFHPDSLRSRIAIVQQDYTRYAFTGRENVTMSDGTDASRLTRALRESHADEIFTSLPDGVDTQLDRQYHGATNLSGGQWQRLALARGLYRSADLLILDEPSAALDAQTENDLFTVLTEPHPHQAVVLITHRVASAASADHIYLLHQGSITDHGTHQHLLAHSDHYAQLVKIAGSV
ncbi:ABC transporter ATP-binding protein [Streptomyces sp. NPDC050658]|uniref:ABC transporter ATP-binding protein n=1 Tax=unclassified Streptomyces TaxID=2593676 RepID=UPI00343E59A2